MFLLGPNPSAFERYEKIHVSQMAGSKLVGPAHQRLDNQQTAFARNRRTTILENLQYFLVRPVIQNAL